MKPLSLTAMRAATDATRAGNLSEATRLIQSTLAGTAPEPAPSARTITASRLDKNAQVVQPETDAPKPQRRWSPLDPAARPADPALPDGAQFVHRTAQAGKGAHDFRLYIPSRTPRGLIVMLHGCKQNPEDFARGTGMNVVAEDNALLVAYPHQPQSANPSACWNWFEPTHQARGRGEPDSLARITHALLDEFDVGDAFVAGLSAGGAMAAVMGETYPELYKAVGIHSGLAPCSATNMVSAFAAMRGNGQAAPVSSNRVPMIVFQGSADPVVDVSNADAILRSSAAGAPDSDPTKTTAGGRTVTKTDYDQGRIELWRIEGAGHAWAGGQRTGSYTDPTGPNASREMVRFFLEQCP